MLANEPAARDFVADAYAHSKFVGCSEEAKPFLSKVLGADKLDSGFIAIGSAKDTVNFVQECRKLRFWDRANGHLLSNSQLNDQEFCRRQAKRSTTSVAIMLAATANITAVAIHPTTL